MMLVVMVMLPLMGLSTFAICSHLKVIHEEFKRFNDREEKRQ